MLPRQRQPRPNSRPLGYASLWGWEGSGEVLQKAQGPWFLNHFWEAAPWTQTEGNSIESYYRCGVFLSYDLAVKEKSNPTSCLLLTAYSSWLLQLVSGPGNIVDNVISETWEVSFGRAMCTISVSGVSLLSLAATFTGLSPSPRTNYLKLMKVDFFLSKMLSVVCFSGCLWSCFSMLCWAVRLPTSERGTEL